MNLRFRNLLAVVAVAVGWQAGLLHAQTTRVRQMSERYGKSTSLTAPNHHANDSSPLGRVDGGVNQAIELGITGQFDAGQSGSPGLDQIQSSRAGGRGAALASSAMGTSRGVQKATSQVYAKPSYVSGARPLGQTPTGTSLLAPSKQGGAMGVSSGAQNSKVVPGSLPGQANATRRSTGSNTTHVQRGMNDVRKRLRTGDVDLSTIPGGGQSLIQDGEQDSVGNSGQTSLERLQDPFLTPSRAGFEGFRNGFDFERSCGDSCNLRATAPGEPSYGEQRGRRRPGGMPDDQMPATKSGNDQTPSRAGVPATAMPTKPY